MTALPPTYYLHVWWARRPLVACRAAILGALLPADADRDRFLHILGIHGDPVGTRAAIDRAKRTGENLGQDPYGYQRAFKHNPTALERHWFEAQRARLGLADPIVLDPMAGGGSIPIEVVRLGLATLANDLNPVAALVLRATVEWPAKFGTELLREFDRLAKRFVEQALPCYEGVFAQEPSGVVVLGYLWARTITCPYCDGEVPLAPNWRLAPDGTGVRLLPETGDGPGSPGRVCRFEIVQSAREQSEGTVRRGDAQCPYPDCGRVIPGDEIRRQAQAGNMGDRLFAVVYKQRVVRRTKNGRLRETWQRGYRAPRPEDEEAIRRVERALEEKLLEWEALDIIPIEEIESAHPKYDPRRWGMRRWRDFFSPRQLYGHGTSVEIFRELLEEERTRHGGDLPEVTRAAFGYLGIAIDRLADWNSRMCTWELTKLRMAHTFDRHDFSFKWSYAEMAPLIVGLGYDWAIGQTAKALKELVELVRPGDGPQGDLHAQDYRPPPIKVTCKSADALDHLEDGAVDLVVVDPPYYDNVMYAELSDFFYVWLKRTAGLVFPELFVTRLTDKENEAVANPARFRDERGAKEKAYHDYRERMARVFAECRRVLKPDGLMVLMFTHKSTGAWDALVGGLMEAGFAVTASWPVNTEAEGSLHIREKAAANSTIFLVCRPRVAAGTGETVWWEDLEPRVRAAVRRRIEEFREAGIRGVDLYLAAFGPALEVFTRHWPVARGQPRPPRSQPRRRQREVAVAPEDPFTVTPEDVLEAARSEVKEWRMRQLLGAERRQNLDPLTEWFVLAWDVFGAPRFPYDEALQLARVVGVDLDGEVIGRVAEKKQDRVVLWDSEVRQRAHAVGPIDGGRSWLDTVHRAAYLVRTGSVEMARARLEEAGVLEEPGFLATLQALLEVLPPSRAFSGIDPVKGTEGAASDFEALEKLRRAVLAEKVPEPQQLALFREEVA